MKKLNKLQIYSERGFIIDLDGGPNIWHNTIKDDYTIIGWVDAYNSNLMLPLSI